MARTPISRGEDLRRDDESGRVRTQIEKQLTQYVNHNDDAFVVRVQKFGKGTANDEEENGQDNEAVELNRFAGPVFDCFDDDQ